MASEEEVKMALHSVIHLPLNIAEGEGVSLSEYYRVQNAFPVFVLANSKGEAISRWTGYTGAARFVNSLKAALRDTTTITRRAVRCRARPALRDVLFLARYFDETRDYLQAIEYYRQAGKLDKNPGRDYSFAIFRNSVGAAWDGIVPVEVADSAAKVVIRSGVAGDDKVVQAVRMMVSLGRKRERTEIIPQYLRVGLEATAGSTNKNDIQTRRLFEADQFLYVNKDTAAAVRKMEESLGRGWQNDPNRLFTFGQYCFERRIHLRKAESNLRTAVNMAPAGPFKAAILHTLAGVLNACGNTEEAVRLMAMAVEESPSNRFYKKELQRFRLLSEE